MQFAGRACFGLIQVINFKKLYSGLATNATVYYSNGPHPDSSPNQVTYKLSHNPNHQLTTCKPDAHHTRETTYIALEPLTRQAVGMRPEAWIIEHPSRDNTATRGPGNQNQKGRSRRYTGTQRQTDKCRHKARTGPQSHRARDLGRAIDMNRDQASTKGNG